MRRVSSWLAVALARSFVLAEVCLQIGFGDIGRESTDVDLRLIIRRQARHDVASEVSGAV
jgi:hypothetical protein